jgi:hypothetical protein
MRDDGDVDVAFRRRAADKVIEAEYAFRTCRMRQWSR